MVRLFFSYAGPSMVLSHSRNRVAAPKIFQWCSLTPGIVWLLRKFSNGALSFLESCGCSRNFLMVLSHSRNRVAASKIFQWCSLTPLNGATTPFSVFQWCGCTSENPFNGAIASFNAPEKWSSSSHPIPFGPPLLFFSSVPLESVLPHTLESCDYQSCTHLSKKENPPFRSPFSFFFSWCGCRSCFLMVSLFSDEWGAFSNSENVQQRGSLSLFL